jgi:predicted GNAT family acetyltransferase
MKQKTRIKNKKENKKQISNLSFHPLTPRRWKDFEKLFGPKGACAGCWCTYWLLKRSEYDRLRQGDGTKKFFRKIVNKGTTPGILAYAGDDAIGWCAIQPRENYPVLQNSRILQPVDDKKVWSIVCFYIQSKYRKQGLTISLINEAVKFAKSKGAKIVEGYPVEPKKQTAPVFIYTGIASAFLRAGFKEVLRRSETRPIMRYYI